jgi:hypothetical protein
MESLKAALENLKEKIKTSWAEQQESPWFIALKERFDELPPLGQKGVLWGTLAFIAFLVLSWPVSSLMESYELGDRFEERRQVLKDLLKIARDVAASPNVPTPPSPAVFKAQFDQRITAAQVKPEQIKESGELPPTTVAGTDQKGFFYRIEKLTIKQAMELGYDLEHSDPSLRLLSMEITAQKPDPHYYDVLYKVVNYAPKASENLAPGGAIADALKNRPGSKVPPKNKGGDDL